MFTFMYRNNWTTKLQLWCLFWAQNPHILSLRSQFWTFLVLFLHTYHIFRVCFKMSPFVDTESTILARDEQNRCLQVAICETWNLSVMSTRIKRPLWRIRSTCASSYQIIFTTPSGGSLTPFGALDSSELESYLTWMLDNFLWHWKRRSRMLY